MWESWISSLVILHKFLGYLICHQPLNFKIRQLRVSDTEGILFNIFIECKLLYFLLLYFSIILLLLFFLIILLLYVQLVVSLMIRQK